MLLIPVNYEKQELRSDKNSTKCSLTPAENRRYCQWQKERTKKLIAISEQLEHDYWKLFLNRTVEVIPEVYKNGNLIGHTGNYLLVKIPTQDDKLLHQTVMVKLIDMEGIYMIGKLV